MHTPLANNIRGLFVTSDENLSSGETGQMMPNFDAIRTSAGQQDVLPSIDESLAHRAGDVKVSIIIPVYNTSEYLHQCLDSAVNQTLKEIEIIVIDDASTDNSLEIIRQYERQNDRIRVIAFEENRGNGFGRNEAIRQATGIYLMFLDSDDWLETNAAEMMYGKAVAHHHDIVMCGYTWHLANIQNEKKNKKVYLPLLEDNDPNFFRYMVQQRKGLSCMPWQFIFAKEFVIRNSICFPNEIYFEDVPFSIKAIYKAKNIGVLRSSLYNYRQRNTSITESVSKKKITDMLVSLVMVKKFLDEENIFIQYQREYLLRFLMHGICYVFMNYFRLSKQEKDEGLDRYMEKLRTSSFMRTENLLFVLQAIAELDADEVHAKESYQRTYNTLYSLIYSYKILRFNCSVAYFIRDIIETKFRFFSTT